MGAQRTTVDEIRVWWKLQDMIELTPEEKEKINYRVETINGQPQPVWDANKALKHQDYELTQDEAAKLARIVKEWQSGYFAGPDRRWLEPLLVQLDKVSTNGNAPAAVPAPQR
jgi:hypothetical protein